jgi:hypothetical protein
MSKKKDMRFFTIGCQRLCFLFHCCYLSFGLSSNIAVPIDRYHAQKKNTHWHNCVSILRGHRRNSSIDRKLRKIAAPHREEADPAASQMSSTPRGPMSIPDTVRAATAACLRAAAAILDVDVLAATFCTIMRSWDSSACISAIM